MAKENSVNLRVHKDLDKIVKELSEKNKTTRVQTTKELANIAKEMKIKKVKVKKEFIF